MRTGIENIIAKLLGDNVQIINTIPLAGGSINESFKVNTNNGVYFIKKNSSSQFPQMFEKEVSGLKTLRDANEIIIPKTIGVAESAAESFLMLEFIESGIRAKHFWEIFGHQLANLHNHTSDFFGLEIDNYIGSLQQTNKKHSNWSDFFREERLEKQVILARNSGLIDKSVVTSFDKFYNHLYDLFPVEPASLLHGDLWNGNFMVNKAGLPVIFDPAVYYGHREMDLGMSKLFGGFDEQFYTSYNKHHPLENGWEERLDYYNLYPLMVHVNLFGSGYVQSVKSIISKF